MKRITLILLILFFIFPLSAQVKTRNVNYSCLHGKWVYDYFNSAGEIIAYEKNKDQLINFGHYLIFNPEQNLQVGKSAQCGNDQSIFRNYGTWKIDYNKETLQVSVDILKQGKKFKIIKLTSTALCLQKLND